MSPTDQLDLARQDASALPFRLIQRPGKGTEVWWDLGVGAWCHIANFAVHELAEDWLLSRIKNSPSR